MSSEGQLKKRQLELLILLYKNTKIPVFLNLAINVEAIIDEAKKEFPNFWEIMNREGDKYHSEEYNEVHLEEYIDEVQDWFLTWHGG